MHSTGIHPRVTSTAENENVNILVDDSIDKKEIGTDQVKDFRGEDKTSIVITMTKIYTNILNITWPSPGIDNKRVRNEEETNKGIKWPYFK